MKLFKQLALVTAVAAASTGAFALEAMDDATLAKKTGQDGLTIKIKPSDTGIQMTKVYIHDNDGLSNTATFKGADADGNGTTGEAGDLGGTKTAGALVVYGDGTNGAESRSGAGTTASPYTYAKTQKGMVIQGGTITVTVDTDAGNTSPSTTNEAFINANVKMEGETHIGIGKIGVGASGTNNGPYTGANTRELVDGQSANDILGAMSLQLSGSELNIQLGAQPQGAMVLMDSTIEDGLTIKNLEVIDNDGATGNATDKGGLMVGSLTITDAKDTTAGYDGSDLHLNSKIDIDGTDGLVVTLTDPSASGMYIYAEDVGFTKGDGKFVGYVAADATATPPVVGATGNVIGDIEVVGLTTGGSTISINGH